MLQGVKTTTLQRKALDKNIGEVGFLVFGTASHVFTALTPYIYIIKRDVERM